ncbi:chemotaxis protein CheW [Psychromonas sp. KJ10-10]|uniref:chemotaxis protein CheW n=1 Tax=Psychromonas sp. KJ10-10 TaxID=3391823 RepID=UPI0039B3EFF6
MRIIKKHTHCINCDVFHETGKKLLSRPAPLLDPKDIIQISDNKSKNINNTSYTFFRIALEWFALPTNNIISVINPSPVCKIPHMSNTIIEGIGYYQSHSMLIINLDKYILSTKPDSQTTINKKEYLRFLLVQSRLGKLAIRVNELWGTERCSQENVRIANIPGDQANSSVVSHRITYQNGQASLIDSDALNQLIEKQF